VSARPPRKETQRSILAPHRSVKYLPQLKDHFKAIEVLRESDLEWVVFINGIFLDCFNPPEIVSYHNPNVFVVDLSNNVAGIPSDGNIPITFTYTFDVENYVLSIFSLEE